MTINRQVRDGQKHQLEQDNMVRDTLILQKINASHRAAFAEKFPGQVEHILRLLTERLQSGLDKRDGVELDNPDTWKMSCKELADLSTAIHHVYIVKEKLRDVQPNAR